MRHDPLNGGYLINFSRPTKVRVDASRSTDDAAGDPQTLLQAMDTLAEERAALQLDIDMKWMGSGI